MLPMIFVLFNILPENDTKKPELQNNLFKWG